MTVIELGEIDAVHRPEPALPRLDRRLGVVAIVLLCLVALSGEAIPEPLVHPLWSVPFDYTDNSLLADGTVYLSRGPGDRPGLTAYDLATGRVRWQTSFAGELGYAGLAVADGLLLLPGSLRTVSGHAATIAFVASTVAIDAATGTQLWQLPGEAQMLYRGAVLMSEYNDRGTVAGLRLLRVDDRQTIWHLTTTDLYTQVVALAGDRPDKLVTVTRDGRVDVYRYADGTRLAGGRVSPVDPRPERGQLIDISATGDHLVIDRTRIAGGNLHRNAAGDFRVYRLDTLAEAWHATSVDGAPFPCGAALCVGSEAGLVAYDLATGRRLWQREGVPGGSPVGPGRLLTDDNGHPVLLDAATGRQVGDRGDGIMVWPVGQSSSGPLYLMRSTLSPPGRTSITRWDLATGRTRLLGAVAAVPGERCEVAGHYLGCAADHAYEVIVLP